MLKKCMSDVVAVPASRGHKTYKLINKTPKTHTHRKSPAATVLRTGTSSKTKDEAPPKSTSWRPCPANKS